MALFPRERDLTRALDRVEIRVDASDFGLRVQDVSMRLDAFLVHHLKWRSRSSIQTLVKDGFVLVDGSTPDLPRGTGEAKVEKRTGRKLRHGGLVIVIIPPEHRLEISEGAGEELDVLYEDDYLLAVDKPPFLAVHPSGRHLVDTLIQRVHARTSTAEIERLGAPRLCHRLDRETSGLVLVAKRPEAHRVMRAQFEAHEVEKEYLAIVRGIPEEKSGSVEMPLGPSRTSRVALKMAVIADGLPSRTDWRVVQEYPEKDRTLVSCRLHSGRQHQIRVHMEAIGYPLVGDKLYGGDEGLFLRNADGDLDDWDRAELELPRHALHNHRLKFRHPKTSEWLEVISPLPKDLADYLQ